MTTQAQPETLFGIDLATVLTYAGMRADTLFIWVLIAAAAGSLTGLLLRGPKIGLFGNLVLGLLGLFAAGGLLKHFGIDLTAKLLELAPQIGMPYALWLDMAIVSFVGALILRLPVRLLVRG